MIIQLNKITKVYGHSWRIPFIKSSDPLKPAIEEIDLEIPKGEIFTLLGPNGAGKTTLINIMATLLLPTSGTVIINGMDATRSGADVRASIGLVSSEERSFYWRLGGKENLLFFGALNNLQGKTLHNRVEEVADLLGIRSYYKDRFDSYSSGMKQKLAIARSLLHKPSILFLDEPTKTLDPVAARKLWEIIQTLHTDMELTIFLVTHSLWEAKHTSHRIGILKDGRLKRVGTWEQLKHNLAKTHNIEVLIKQVNEQLVDVLLKYKSIRNFTFISAKHWQSHDQHKNMKKLVIEITRDSNTLKDIVNMLFEQNCDILEINTTETASFDETILQLLEE